MGISAKRGYRIRQMDVITAFLYGFLFEEIFIIQPTMFEDGTSRVCLLRKALYGLKQSPRVWYQTLMDFLKKLGFHKTEADNILFVSSDKTIFIAVYVEKYTASNLVDRFNARLVAQGFTQVHGIDYN